MFGDHFYHKQIRNTVIAFGTIFNNVNIKRLDSSGNPIQTLRVPLSYSPKEKFLARLDAQQDLTGDDSKVAITLPRMSFEITGYSYDPTRKLNKNQRLGRVTTNADTSKLKSTAIGRGYKKTSNPQPLFPWGDPSLSNWSSNNYLTLTFSGYTSTTWTWNGSKYIRSYYDAYKNQKTDNVHYWADQNGNTGQITTDTVIALFCEPYIHPLQLPSVKTVGQGRAIILHGGKLLDAKWKRGSNSDPFHIVDSNNNILYVPKGKVWISLVPNTKNPSFG